MSLSILDAPDYSKTLPQLSRGRKMTGKLRMSQEHHPACCRRLRLSKKRCLLPSASCLEYVRVGSTQLLILIILLLIRFHSALI